MEDAYRHLNWEWNNQEEDQWKLAQFHSMLELETRIACVHKEIARKRDEVLYYKSLLTKIINERDDFQFKSETLSKNLILQQETKKLHDNASFVRATHTSYIKDGSIIKLVSSSTQKSDKTPLHSQSPPSPSMSLPHVLDGMVLTKKLPEKGRFLQAMMDAGPLLQTLLVVGPLPRWQNAPPKLNAIKLPTSINPPPLTNSRRIFPGEDAHVNVITCDSGLICKKRGLDRSYEVIRTTKNQKSCSPLTN